MNRLFLLVCTVAIAFSGCSRKEPETYGITSGYYRSSEGITLKISFDRACTLFTATDTIAVHVAGTDYQEGCFTNDGATCRNEFWVLEEPQIVIGADTIVKPLLYAEKYSNTGPFRFGVILGSYDPVQILGSGKQIVLYQE